MLAVAVRVLRDEEEVRDVLQDSFLSAFRSMKQFRNDSELGTWLYRIVFNTALMRLRYERRRRNRSIEDPSPFFEGEAQRPQTIASRPPGPESVLLRNETRAVVRACVAQLPDGYRRVLTLRDLEELDTTETARRLGITKNSSQDAAVPSSAGPDETRQRNPYR